jgi:hypothetical protein
MGNMIAIVLVVAFLAGILFVAKNFLKPPKGKLPDCCSLRGNRDVKL